MFETNIAWKFQSGYDVDLVDFNRQRILVLQLVDNRRDLVLYRWKSYSSFEVWGLFNGRYFCLSGKVISFKTEGSINEISVILVQKLA